MVFNATKSIRVRDGLIMAPLAEFDDDRKKFRIITYSAWYGYDKNRAKIYDYSQIIAFELMENGTTSVSGGLGSALIGGALFGGVGAIVGGTVGTKTHHTSCSSLQIKVTLNDIKNPTLYIKFHDNKKGEISTTSVKYQKLYALAHECISILDIICQSLQSKDGTTDNAKSNLSAADELAKFKGLLDVGAITQEEFNHMKKQLLKL